MICSVSNVTHSDAYFLGEQFKTKVSKDVSEKDHGDRMCPLRKFQRQRNCGTTKNEGMINQTEKKRMEAVTPEAHRDYQNKD